MLHKTTNKLFQGTYQYKIVLVCAYAYLFRGQAAADTLKRLSEDIETRKFNTQKTQDEFDYALTVANALVKMPGIDIRVESPWISIYTNTKAHLATLSLINEEKVKYIAQPPASTNLAEGTIIVPKRDYDYRVTIGRSHQENSAFVAWAESNSKILLTKGVKTDLLKSRTWGGTYFYITGENNLLMAKMHLGSVISKIERIIKA